MTRLPLQPPLRFCILSVAGIVSRGFPSRVPSVVIHLRRIQSEFGVFRLGYLAVLELTFLGELGLELQIVADLGLFEFASCNNSVSVVVYRLRLRAIVDLGILVTSGSS